MDVLSLMFPLQSEWLQQTGDDSLEELYKDLGKAGELCLIHSKKPMNKTALLFQCAVSECTRSGHTIIITQQPLENLPLHIHGMPQPSAGPLKNLKILYMMTVDEVKHYLASIHQMSLLPDLIIVENLEHYIKECSPDTAVSDLAKIFALLLDAAAYIKNKSDNNCQIVASITDTRVNIIDTCQTYATCSYKLEFDEGCKIGTLHSERMASLTETCTKHIFITYKELADCIKLEHISLKKSQASTDIHES